MATVSKWNPFGVALDITATPGTVTRKSATQFTVVINASWETYYNGANTNYAMSATSGGVTKTITAYDGKTHSSGSASFTGTYSISGNGAQTKTITVTFKNFKNDSSSSASKNVTFDVSVPAWTSYTVTYNANGGTGAPGKQTKWKDQTLTLSSTKPTRTGYSFQGWALSKANADAGTVYYQAGGSCGKNENLTLYAVWKANTYSVNYNANGGTGAPATDTKIYGITLSLSITKPTRTNYNFLGWATSATATTAQYSAGGNYTANSAVTLYAVWELAYVKPRITKFNVYRGDEDGNQSDTGEYVYVGYACSCDRNIETVVVRWNSGSGGNTSSHTVFPGDDTSVTANGLSIDKTKLIWSDTDDKFSLDATYTVTLTVTDEMGSTSTSRTLAGSKFVIDIRPEGKGIAFGKPAERDGFVDFGFNAVFNGSVEGSVFGLGVLPQIGENEDFNDYLNPGIYGIGAHATAGTVKNNPAGAQAGRLIVCAATGGNVGIEYWTYLQQWYVPMSFEASGQKSIYVRTITRSPNSAANYYAWLKFTATAV